MDHYYRNEDERNQSNNGRNSTNSVVDGRARNVPGSDYALEDTDAPASESGAAQDSTDAQLSSGFSTIPPNESRHSKLKRMAQTEEENFQRYREANRPTSVHINPEMLGGAVSLAEARERQFEELRKSRIQKKLKKEEEDRKRRQEKEAENQSMKDKQREKAERLEDKRRQEEWRRREQQKETHVRTTDHFLQRLERTDSAPVASSSATRTSPWARAQEYREGRRGEENTALQLRKEGQRSKSEALERQKAEEVWRRERGIQEEHRQVNSAFLDRLQGLGGQRETERPPVAVEENSRDWQTQASAPHDPLTLQEPSPEQGPSVWAEKAGPDYEWMVMKLQSRFPESDRAFLEDIITQCNGDYQQACQLLQ